MSVGTVTTGDPGTEAAVTNSGTENAAVLNFTIPKGQDGAAAPVELLSAYSTPSQSASSGDSLIFDRNDLNYGTSIAHSSNSSAFTISQPGIYTVSFHSSAAPATGDTLPLNLLFYLNLRGGRGSGAHLHLRGGDGQSGVLRAGGSLHGSRHPECGGGGRRLLLQFRRDDHPETGGYSLLTSG